MPRLAAASGQSLTLRDRGREGDVSASFRWVSKKLKGKNFNDFYIILEGIRMFQLKCQLRSAEQMLSEHPLVGSPGAGTVGRERTFGAREIGLSPSIGRHGKARLVRGGNCS